MKDGLNSVVAPDQVRPLDLMKGVVERVDDLVDRLACVSRSGLQPYDPSVDIPRKIPENMDVKVVLGESEDEEAMSKVQQRVRDRRSHMRNR